FSAIGFALASGLVAAAEPAPLSPVEQAYITNAIRRGAYYLKLNQGPNGTWAPKDGPHPVGYSALPGLTLLECGVPPGHSVVQRAALHTRAACAKLTNTYEIALAILFL